ncbi:MAG TPA: hypothetical protein VFJ95_07000, partial [Gammaproteobacteria bacterium]|nr:hypothetical protein [Gammaproteobacteria bacterium]
MPRGTRLIGRVTESRPHARRSSSAGGDVGSRLGIVFDRAVLADGREIPVAATIRAVASNDADAAASFAGADRGIGGGVFGAGNTAGSGSVGSTGIVGGAAGLAGGAAGVGSTAGGALAGAGGA